MTLKTVCTMTQRNRTFCQKYDSKNWTLFEKMTQRIERFENMTQRIERFEKVTQRIEHLENMTQRTDYFFENGTQRIEPFWKHRS